MPRLSSNTHLFLPGYRKRPTSLPQATDPRKQTSPTTKKRREKGNFSERHSPIHGREYPGRNSRQDQARTVLGAIPFTHTSTSHGERKKKRTRHYSIHREELSPQRRIQTRGKPQDNHLYNICKTTYRQREESRLFSHTNSHRIEH